MRKIDYRKELGPLYKASARVPSIVEVPSLSVLALDGHGDPNTSRDYADAVAALYSVSYTLKFAVKRGPAAVDYRVMPLEGLWWSEDMQSFESGDKSQWQWSMRIVQPPIVTDDDVAAAIESVTRKKSLPALGRLRFETFAEGTAAQVLHVGPFAEEGPTIERLHTFIAERGSLRGKHHEIYLSDIRRADPAKWKTIIRQPFAPRE